MEPFSIFYRSKTQALMIVQYLDRVLGLNVYGGMAPEDWVQEFSEKYCYITYRPNMYIHGYINANENKFLNLEDFIDWRNNKNKTVKIHCQTFARQGDYIQSEDFCFRKCDVQTLLQGVKQTKCITGIVWEGDYVVNITDVEKLLEL